VLERPALAWPGHQQVALTPPGIGAVEDCDDGLTFGERSELRGIDPHDRAIRNQTTEAPRISRAVTSDAIKR
jgi:hypothetical protein